MPATLDEIVARTRARVQQARGSADMPELRRRAEAREPRGFRRTLEKRAADGPAIIAELKKASPSKGRIRGSFPVARVAAELEQAGAAALSVLTEPEFFEGSLSNLVEASAATNLPCLRKDFMMDEFQLLEARAHGADAVLLIVAALKQSELEHLARAAKQLNLDVLCEVHSEAELDRALDAGCDLIGVNSRDLRTFKVDPKTLFVLASKIPKNVLGVAESGLSSAVELRELAAAGYLAFLIGESLMRAEWPGVALRQLIAEFHSPIVSAANVQSRY